MLVRVHHSRQRAAQLAAAVTATADVQFSHRFLSSSGSLRCGRHPPGCHVRRPTRRSRFVGLFSAAEPWLSRGARLLDLGCGPRDQATPAGYFGLDYVGIDFDSANADIHADAHAIPFQNESFDAVVSYAVVEHLYNPFVAVAEVARVLRSGGIFFGAVCGEPFHDSYFHHTAFGVMSVMREAGFHVTRLWPSYDTLQALAGMGRYHTRDPYPHQRRRSN